MSADTPKDRDLEALLDATSALRQQYHVASQEEPPTGLDEAIRAAARREVRARPFRIGSGFGASWRISASIAAVLVVSVTVAVMVSRHDGQSRVIGEQPSPPTGLPAEMGASKDQAELTAARRATKKQSEGDTAKATPQARPPAEVAAPAAPVPVEAPMDKSERAAKIDSQIGRTAKERDEPLRAQAPATTGLPAATESPTPAANATAAQAPVPETPAKAAADATVPAQPLTKKRALSDSAEAELKASPWEKDPQAWLAHIEGLRSAGRIEDAETSFRAFRSRYPDFQLPAGFVPPVPAVSN